MWIVHTSASIEPHRINWNYPIEIKKKWRETKRKKNYLYENWKERINKQKRNHVCVVNAKKSHARQESNKISPFTWNHDVTSFDEQQYVYFYHYLLWSVFHFFCMLFFLFIVCCLRNKWRGASLLLGSGEYNFRQHVYMILFVIPISSIDFHCSRHSSFHVRSNSQKKEKKPRHNCVNVFGVLCSFTWLCTFKIEWKSWHSQFKPSAWFRMKCDWNLDTQRFLTLLCICKDKLNYLMEVWRWEYISMELFGLLSLWMEYNGHSCVCSCLCFLSFLLFFSSLFSANLMITHNWLKLRKQNNFSVGVSKCVCVVLLSFFNDFDWTYCIIWQNKFKTHAHNRIKVNKSGRCIQVTAWLLRGAVGFLFDEFNNYWTQWLKFYRKNLL